MADCRGQCSQSGITLNEIRKVERQTRSQMEKDGAVTTNYPFLNLDVAFVRHGSREMRRSNG